MDMPKIVRIVIGVVNGNISISRATREFRHQ